MKVRDRGASIDQADFRLVNQCCRSIFMVVQMSIILDHEIFERWRILAALTTPRIDQLSGYLGADPRRPHLPVFLALPPYAHWGINANQNEKRSPLKLFEDFTVPDTGDDPALFPVLCHERE